MPRIEPLTPPYEPEIGEALRKWMPPGVAHDPLQLFRVLHRNPELASRMRVVGAGLLAHGRLPAQDREIVIARACARSGCEYEWGVHAAAFGDAVGLTKEQINATVTGDLTPWSPEQRLLLKAVDELHDSATLTQDTWDGLAKRYDQAQMLEFIVLTGWYRTIGQLANSLHLDNEPWAHTFPTNWKAPTAPASRPTITSRAPTDEQLPGQRAAA
ncbi:carboxymuconolactone decarboxylase family protein [Actinomadura fulvescens]|uniref:Carboxymuconolactone decarboxylase family protein n=1 Tax=Actinomadura fulvescens TaxID=46160 RepID=A0ABN3PHS0_9ACTN